MPGYKNADGLPLKVDGVPASSNYCCVCGFPVGKNCICEVTGPWYTGSDARDSEGNDNYFEWISDPDNLYNFTFDRPFAVNLFIGDGTTAEDPVNTCQCMPTTDLDDDGNCGLPCVDSGGGVGVYVSQFICWSEPPQGPDPCFICKSLGAAFSGYPNDTIGKKPGDPCNYGAVDGTGSTVGKCHDISTPPQYIAIPGAERGCCKFGGAYEMSNDTNCDWQFDPKAPCLLPFTNLPPEQTQITDPPRCDFAGRTNFQAFVDRCVYGDGADVAPFNVRWYFLIRTRAFHPDATILGTFSVERLFMYRSDLLTSDANGCYLTGGWHNMTLFKDWVIPANYASARPITWCQPPPTLQLLAYGATA